jgi:lactoylglutathione lyase
VKFLHSMIRVADLDASLRFYRDALGLQLIRHKDYPAGRFSLYYLASAEGEPEIELTHNWDTTAYTNGNNFGHLAFCVDDIYALCQRLQDAGIRILRPPRDGKMAFVKDPNGISIELLQRGAPLEAKQPWQSMESTGSW